jgi:hypothetical protein
MAMCVDIVAAGLAIALVAIWFLSTIRAGPMTLGNMRGTLPYLEIE